MNASGLMMQRLKSMCTPESEANGLSFKCRSSDVFITTYPKCGTTWVSFICHCLRTRGDTDFVEITQVVPWTIFALDCKQDLHAEQCANPRLFKVCNYLCTYLPHTKLLYLPAYLCSLTRAMTRYAREVSTSTALGILSLWDPPSTSFCLILPRWSD
jgi:Sulfotransferase domain